MHFSFHFDQLAIIFGSIAAFCTTVAFVPQVIHTIKTRDVSGISLGMYSTFSFGVLMWLVYGIMLGSWPMILANSVTFILAAIVLAMKIKYRTSAPKQRNGIPLLAVRQGATPVTPELINQLNNELL